MTVRIIYILLIVLCIQGCLKHEERITGPKTLENDYSERFEIQDSGSYRKLIVYDPWQGAKNRNFVYYLSHSRTDLPLSATESNTIIYPVKSVVCTSTTHIAMIAGLEKTGTIKAVSGSDYIYNPELRERIERGEVTDIGFENGYNTELIYSLNPDLVFVYGVGSESASIFRKLIDMGIPVIFIADYLESHPLARAEWIKVFGEVFNSRSKSDSLFYKIQSEYSIIRDTIALFEVDEPKVMLGLPFKDKWFVSPSDSYISRLIKDAGGKYLWSDLQSEYTVPLSLEAVCRKAVDADIWLNAGTAGSINDILRTDERIASLPVLSEGEIYNNNNRLNKYGGNDYWESGSINPHIILKDLAKIINPALFPEHELYYYTKLRIEEEND